ncbi:MAG: hypothetical protein IJC46_09610 [Clostridia bacterium]|nr:hypothetical protein [Clostridia bacterium]
MSKGVRRLKWLIAPILLCLIGVGSGFYADYKFNRDTESMQEVVQFGYAGTKPTVKEKVACERVEDYRGEYRDAAASYYRKAYRQAVGDRGELVYGAILYAFDHQYDYVCLPALVREEQLFECAYNAVFDHPLLEENLAMDVVSVRYTYQDKEVLFYEITLPTNDAEHIDKKMVALERAKELVREYSAPAEEETARRLYDWMVRNVRYIEDADYNDDAPHYLYDALLNGASNCDGISNAYALLLNLSGIECFNVSSMAEEGEPGHTWNVLKLNGKYYQADVTAETGFYEVTGENLYLHFARSAEVICNDPYEEMVAKLAPPCLDTDRDRLEVELFFRDTELSSDERAMLDAAIDRLESGERFVVIWCGALAEMDGEEKVDLLSRWFRNCHVDVQMVSAGNSFCVICRK